MSYQVGNTCYQTVESAWSAMAAQLSGSIVEHQGVAYVLDAQAVPTGVGIAYTEVGGSTPAFSQTLELTPVGCQLLGIEEGAQLALLVVGLWAVAFGFRAIARLLWQSTDGGYGT